VYVAIQIDRTAVVAEQRQRRFQTQLVENIVTRSGSDAENRIRIPEYFPYRRSRSLLRKSFAIARRFQSRFRL
jgi:hypothetical protein